VSASEARHSLATALSTLRPRLGLDALETSRDNVRLVPGRVALDLDRLQAGEVVGTEVTGPLEVAAFLDGFDITDSAEFTHWKDRQQARLLPVIKDALLVLIDRCRRTGDTRQIEQVADRMLALDELSEEAIRAKMEARAFAGDRLTALEIFEAWKKKLAEELQAVPSDLVEGMAVRLRRRGWERTTLVNIPNVPTDQWRGRPFIGRTAEYQVLYERWEAARKGMPGHVLVLGDSGIGKTTLVQRLTTAAGLEGAAISRVQCYDIEREIPYSAISTLVLGLLDCPGFSASSPESLSVVSRMVPEVRRRFPNIPRADDAHGETARIRLTEACLEILSSIAEEHPIVLVIDDVHLTDDVSLAVLHLIMRRAPKLPVMVVLVARPRELGQSSQALRLKESATALGLRELELYPLNEIESGEMLDSLVRTDDVQPGITAKRALLRSAAGFPMILELLVQDWKTCGEQSLALSIESMTATLDAESHAQSFYKHILARLTHSMDHITRNVLNLASILGHRLNELSLYALVDLSTAQTVGSMAELVNRRILRDGAHGLEFINELVRAAAYVSVSPTLRRVLHANVADHLIAWRRSGDDGVELEIAWHCMRAGRYDEATRFLLDGARQSLRRGAVHSAERALATALPHLFAGDRNEASLLLAEVLQEQGRWLDSLAAISQYHTDQKSDIAVILEIVATFWTNVPSTDVAVRNVRILRHLITDAKSIQARVKAASAAALMLTHLRSVNEAKDLLACVNGIPTTSLDSDDRITLAETKARLLYNAFERGPCSRELIDIVGRLRESRQVNSKVASLHTGMGALACSHGQYSEALHEFRHAYDVCLRLGNDTGRGCRATQLALCHFRLGDYPEVIEWSARALETFGGTFSGYVECQTAQYLGCSYALRGEAEKAFEALERVESRISGVVPGWLNQAWLMIKADVLYLTGRRNESFIVARDAIGNPRPILHNPFFAGPFARWLSLTSRGTIHETRAKQEIGLLVRELETFDALDQVEVLCADRLLSSRSAPDVQINSQKIGERLLSLPLAVAEQLDRLGVLSN
jgi:tetratricopeptide (TPR) repeat protein